MTDLHGRRGSVPVGVEKMLEGVRSRMREQGIERIGSMFFAVDFHGLLQRLERIAVAIEFVVHGAEVVGQDK